MSRERMRQAARTNAVDLQRFAGYLALSKESRVKLRSSREERRVPRSVRIAYTRCNVVMRCICEKKRASSTRDLCAREVRADICGRSTVSLRKTYHYAARGRKGKKGKKHAENNPRNLTSATFVKNPRADRNEIAAPSVCRN